MLAETDSLCVNGQEHKTSLPLSNTELECPWLQGWNLRHVMRKREKRRMKIYNFDVLIKGSPYTTTIKACFVYIYTSTVSNLKE